MTDLGKSNRPYLLLDVDGVLCPFGGDHPEGYKLVFFGEMSVWISQENTRRLKELREVFELVWCTGWDDANELIGPAHNLSPLQVIAFDSPVPGIELTQEGFVITENRFKLAHWKLPWVEEWAGESAFAWVDDEIDESTIQWAEARQAEGIPTLLRRIDPSQGLTDLDTHELIEWATEHK